MSMDAIMNKVILFLVIVALVPSTLITYFGANTSSFDASTLALWGILGILFIVALVQYLMPKGSR